MSKAPQVQAVERLQALAANHDALTQCAASIISHEEKRTPTVEEREALADSIRDHVHGFFPWLENRNWGIAELDGMSKMDAIGADYLEKIGEFGGSLAAHVREKSRALWLQPILLATNPDALWYWWQTEGSSPPPFAFTLAQALWHDKVKPTLKPEDEAPASMAASAKAAASKTSAIQKVPAISAPLLRTICQVLFSKRRSVKSTPAGPVLVNRQGIEVAKILVDGPAALDRLRAKISETRTLLGHRLFRWLVAEALHQAITKKPGYRVIRVMGGFSGLAKLLGVSGSKAGTTLHAILDVLKVVRVPLPLGEDATLVDWFLEQEAPGQKAELRVEVHDALLPGFIHGIKKSTPSEREARALVPIPSALPSFSGSIHGHAEQATLQLLSIAELRHFAADLHANGYVRIPPSRWEDLAREAGASAVSVHEVVEVWTKGPGAFLKRSPNDPELFTLADNFAADREAIWLAGQESHRGRARQALSKKKAKK